MTNARRPARILASLLAVGTLTLATAASADPMLEARVAKLERMLSEQRLSDLLLRIQQLQQEVRDLRGMVEEQQFLLRRRERSSNGQVQAGSDSAGRAAGPAPVQRMSPGAVGPPSASAAAGSLESRARVSNQDFLSRRGPSGLEAAPASGTRLELTPEDTLLPPLPAPETQNGGEREAYREAFEHLKARDYDAARVAFEALLAQFPRGDFADNSRYWLGEISYQAKDYPEARAAFEQLIEQHPSSPKVPGAMLKLGYLDSDLGNIEQARLMLEAVLRRFPDSAEGRLAAKRLAEIDGTPSAN